MLSKDCGMLAWEADHRGFPSSGKRGQQSPLSLRAAFGLTPLTLVLPSVGDRKQYSI